MASAASETFSDLANAREKYFFLSDKEFEVWQPILKEIDVVAATNASKRHGPPPPDEIALRRELAVRRKEFEAHLADSTREQFRQTIRPAKQKKQSRGSKHQQGPRAVLSEAEAQEKAVRKRQVSASHWKPVANGRLTLAVAPTSKRLKELKDRGATHIVTLQKESEPTFKGISGHCAAMGLGWTHVPLSGGRVNGENDLSQLQLGVPQILHLVKSGESVVIHCAAGLHRTGIMGYLVLRGIGCDADQAIAGLHEMRQVTHHEMTQLRKNMPHKEKGIVWTGFEHNCLAGRAEDIHQKHFLTSAAIE